MHKRLSLEMGGKNAMIVMDDADLDLALEGVLWGAFGTTGQRCTATSRLIVHEKVHDRFVQLLCDRADKLRLGPGLEETTEVGPLINEDARKKVEYYVGVGEEEGAQRLIGGARPSDKRLERGWFYRPTVLAAGRCTTSTPRPKSCTWTFPGSCSARRSTPKPERRPSDASNRTDRQQTGDADHVRGCYAGR